MSTSPPGQDLLKIYHKGGPAVGRRRWSWLNQTWLKTENLWDKRLGAVDCSKIKGNKKKGKRSVRRRWEWLVPVAQPSGTPWVPDLFVKPVSPAYHRLSEHHPIPPVFWEIPFSASQPESISVSERTIYCIAGFSQGIQSHIRFLSHHIFIHLSTTWAKNVGLGIRIPEQPFFQLCFTLAYAGLVHCTYSACLLGR